MFNDWKNYIQNEIWAIEIKKLSGFRHAWIMLLRIICMSVKGFNTNKCEFRASALTFYTTLSIVPIAAMLFGIAKGFGYEVILKQHLIEKFAEHREIINMVIGFSEKLLQDTQGGMIAGIGVAVLFWTIIKVLGNIEESFNDIWNVKKSRSFFRKLSDYLSLTLICPIFIILSSSITVFISGNINSMSQHIEIIKGTYLIYVTIKLLPYIMMWLVFTMIYMFMPNAKVNIKSAFLGGIAAGTMFQLIQDSYIIIQVALSQYNIIYGSFSALPLFLIWLQYSWMIALMGAEIAYAHQHSYWYEFEPEIRRITISFRRTLSLWILSHIIKSFDKDGKPVSDLDISEKLGIPLRLTKGILISLTKAGLTAKVLSKELQAAVFQPSQNINKITIAYAVEAIENHGSVKIPLLKDIEFSTISDKIECLQDEITKSRSNVLLKDI